MPAHREDRAISAAGSKMLARDPVGEMSMINNHVTRLRFIGDDLANTIFMPREW